MSPPSGVEDVNQSNVSLDELFRAGAFALFSWALIGGSVYRVAKRRALPAPVRRGIGWGALRTFFAGSEATVPS